MGILKLYSDWYWPLMGGLLLSLSFVLYCLHIVLLLSTRKLIKFSDGLDTWNVRMIPTGLALYVDIKTAEQRTIIQQYGDWYTGC